MQVQGMIDQVSSTKCLGSCRDQGLCPHLYLVPHLAHSPSWLLSMDLPLLAIVPHGNEVVGQELSWHCLCEHLTQREGPGTSS